MARKTKYDLQSQLNEMLDEIALSENKGIDLNRKLERQKARLQKFGKQTGDVQLELEQIASLIPQLNEHIEAIKDVKLREEALRRRDALILRQTVLSERAQEYRPEVRAQIEEVITNLYLEIESNGNMLKVWRSEKVRMEELMRIEEEKKMKLK